MKMGYWLKLQSVFFFTGGVEGDMFISIPFSHEERALKLAQMYPEDEKNKEQKDRGLKNNTFFLS